jgi:pimeloyl-ACP methyl ester carboxylesterase
MIVAHSMGGVTANQYAALHANTIAGIIYVCAIAPCDGHSGTETMLEAGATSALLRADTAVPGSNQAAVLTEAGAAEALYGLCSQLDTQRTLARLCPEPIDPLLAPVKLSSKFFRIPEAYIATRDDRAAPLPFQIKTAGRMDATLDVIDGDHSPFYSAPGSLFGALLKHR